MALSSNYIEKLKTEGYEANLNGLLPDDNPYQNEDTRAAWQAGYDEREDHLIDKMRSTHHNSFEIMSGFIGIFIILSLIVCIVKLIWSYYGT